MYTYNKKTQNKKNSKTRFGSVGRGRDKSVY